MTFFDIVMNERIVYCFWTESNPMSEMRKYALYVMPQTVECDVVLVHKGNLHTFVLPDHPLHEAYPYLSAVHKSDYLRTYFMHFYGGGYADIKIQTGSWKSSFEELYNSDAYICGYREFSEDGVASRDPSIRARYREMIGNGEYICKPQTPFTKAWYSRTIALLDERLSRLRKHPANHARDCKERSNYPIEWNELLGRIFHPLCLEHPGRILFTLPAHIYINMRDL
jgi:hypothetical protein